MATDHRPARRCYLGLGANLGASAGMLRDALARIGETSQLDAVSSFYLSRPWGVTDQPDFVNAVARILDPRSPQELLAWLHDLEEHFGRRRLRHWGPRTLDLDLLSCGDLWYQGWELEVPHPGLYQRAFVLGPLLELEPDFRHPVTGTPACEAWDELSERDRKDIRRLALGA